MGGGTGGEQCGKEDEPGLFIAVVPCRSGDHSPPLLFLAGQFEEAFTPASSRPTDARLVISPWSDQHA